MALLPRSLFALLRAYGGVTSPLRLSHYSFRGLSFVTVHDFFLHDLLLDDHFRAYPPSEQFQRVWWKWALEQLEGLLQNEDDGADVEIDGRLYEHCSALLTSSTTRSSVHTSTPDAPRPSYVTHFFSLDPAPAGEADRSVDTAKLLRATLLESRTTIEAGTTGLRTWQASRVLARYLLAHQELVANAKVLELGAGAGYLGVVVAAIQTSHSSTPTSKDAPALVLTDFSEQVLERCRDNVRLACNPSAGHLHLEVRHLDWFDALPTAADHPTDAIASFLSTADPDIVLGADIVYDPSIIPALIATLRLALAPAGVRTPASTSARSAKSALLALTVRNERTVAAFVTAAEAEFRVEDMGWTWTGDGEADRGGCEPEGAVKMIRLSLL